MEKFKEYLNIFPHKEYAKEPEKQDALVAKYKDEVWELLQIAYAPIGGIKGCDTVEQLIADSDLWKIKKRNGQISALSIYTFKRGGRKAIAGCARKTPEGKEDLYQIFRDDFKQVDRGAWIEVSDGMEHCIFKYCDGDRYKITRNVAAGNMPDKEFFMPKTEKDDYHYIRRLGGEKHEKIMVGNPPWNPVDNFLADTENSDDDK